MLIVVRLFKVVKKGYRRGLGRHVSKSTDQEGTSWAREHVRLGPDRASFDDAMRYSEVTPSFLLLLLPRIAGGRRPPKKSPFLSSRPYVLFVNGEGAMNRIVAVLPVAVFGSQFESGPSVQYTRKLRRAGSFSDKIPQRVLRESAGGLTQE